MRSIRSGMRHILLLILITLLLLIVALLSSDYQINAANTYNSSVLLVGQSINHARPQDNLVNNNTTGYSYHRASILNYNMTTNNGSSTATLIGKTEVKGLPNLGIAPPGSQSHLIPFHPKNQSTYLADKKKAAFGLLNKS